MLLPALSRHNRGACSKAPIKTKLSESSACSEISLSFLSGNSGWGRPPGADLGPGRTVKLLEPPCLGYQCWTARGAGNTVLVTALPLPKLSCLQVSVEIGFQRAGTAPLPVRHLLRPEQSPRSLGRSRRDRSPRGKHLGCGAEASS